MLSGSFYDSTYRTSQLVFCEQVNAGQVNAGRSMCALSQTTYHTVNGAFSVLQWISRM